MQVKTSTMTLEHQSTELEINFNENKFKKVILKIGRDEAEMSSYTFYKLIKEAFKDRKDIDC